MEKMPLQCRTGRANVNSVSPYVFDVAMNPRRKRQTSHSQWNQESEAIERTYPGLLQTATAQIRFRSRAVRFQSRDSWTPIELFFSEMGTWPSGLIQLRVAVVIFDADMERHRFTMYPSMHRTAPAVRSRRP